MLLFSVHLFIIFIIFIICLIEKSNGEVLFYRKFYECSKIREFKYNLLLRNKQNEIYNYKMQITNVVLNPSNVYIQIDFLYFVIKIIESCTFVSQKLLNFIYYISKIVKPFIFQVIAFHIFYCRKCQISWIIFSNFLYFITININYIIEDLVILYRNRYSIISKDY